MTCSRKRSEQNRQCPYWESGKSGNDYCSQIEQWRGSSADFRLNFRSLPKLIPEKVAEGYTVARNP